jgi:hypothetical protein
MKFKMNDMNLIRYGESEGGGRNPPSRFVNRLNYRYTFTLNSINQT